MGTVHASMTDALHTAATMSAKQGSLMQHALLGTMPVDLDKAHWSGEVNVVDDVLGRTPLHHAAYAGNRVMLDALLAAGADIDAVDSWDGSTPLDVARARNRRVVAARLLEVGASSALFGKSR